MTEVERLGNALLAIPDWQLDRCVVASRLFYGHVERALKGKDLAYRREVRKVRARVEAEKAERNKR